MYARLHTHTHTWITFTKIRSMSIAWMDACMRSNNGFAGTQCGAFSMPCMTSQRFVDLATFNRRWLPRWPWRGLANEFSLQKPSHEAFRSLHSRYLWCISRVCSCVIACDCACVCACARMHAFMSVCVDSDDINRFPSFHILVVSFYDKFSINSFQIVGISYVCASIML